MGTVAAELVPVASTDSGVGWCTAAMGTVAAALVPVASTDSGVGWCTAALGTVTVTSGGMGMGHMGWITVEPGTVDTDGLGGLGKITFGTGGRKASL